MRATGRPMRATSIAPPLLAMTVHTDRKRGAVLMDQSSRDETLAGVGAQGRPSRDTVSCLSSEDKHRKRSRRRP
jgi:hypothetical protein